MIPSGRHMVFICNPSQMEFCRLGTGEYLGGGDDLAPEKSGTLRPGRIQTPSRHFSAAGTHSRPALATKVANSLT